MVLAKNRSHSLEWNEFYRPAASNYLMSWLFALEPSSNGLFLSLKLFLTQTILVGFSQYLINKICISASMLTTDEMKEAPIPDDLKTLDEPLGLKWNHYDDKINVFVKFAIRLIFGKSNDTAKFVAVYILKKFVFIIYNIL